MSFALFFVAKHPSPCMQRHVEFDPAKICMLHCAQVVEVRRIDPKVCGGGRGLFATRPISVGTVVAVEEPFLLVPDEREARETLHTALVRGISLDRSGTCTQLCMVHSVALRPSQTNKSTTRVLPLWNTIVYHGYDILLNQSVDLPLILVLASI